ncbi:hypothetical protein CS0771_08660 [Catellatospora sp. IY07-71]|uniref:hypothetical protein n=1 Tax=Catellatospora sp. IY07-71 TaxID=2728827 RepID=UPI001BB3E990|nr:hypothetical protein [Catellatospora sp. IY07-71]BCJ71322.1 hypothetical protein CS0771_08660 [Catellatospora sp. IY07-71]
MTDKNPLRSPAVIIGGVVVLVAALACAMDDDDDCDSQPAPRQTVFAAGNSGIRLAEPPTSAEPLPASGGFGTHLASCGG